MSYYPSLSRFPDGTSALSVESQPQQFSGRYSPDSGDPYTYEATWTVTANGAKWTATVHRNYDLVGMPRGVVEREFFGFSFKDRIESDVRRWIDRLGKR